ncbi:hypothetical protein [Ulvibacter antarcticus]|uniref:Uncharacterized protein n=1 Tax=Ulvibacter antarcticus TaxID=442714 RepID=A0A3L9YD95_9FLAO|nr:hypothetical protein [Ulvibacter antarcticus]RMA58693.1 hypothetical protein BXY75_2068 [Ulvibacter antarcticus]
MNKKNSVKGAVNNMVSTTKDIAAKVNGKALATTEVVITDTIEVAEQWQTVTKKAIKESLKLASAQQNIVFDALDGFKGQIQLSKKRFTKLIA